MARTPESLVSPVRDSKNKIRGYTVEGDTLRPDGPPYTKKGDAVKAAAVTLAVENDSDRKPKRRKATRSKADGTATVSAAQVARDRGYDARAFRAWLRSEGISSKLLPSELKKIGARYERAVGK